MTSRDLELFMSLISTLALLEPVKSSADSSSKEQLSVVRRLVGEIENALH